MSYKTTITFPIQKINDVDTIQAILEFTHNIIGTDRFYNAQDYNLRILNYGKLEISYDLEDAFLVPGTYSLSIGDPDKILDNFFFGTNAEATATDKQAKVTVKINGINKFIGNILEDSIEYDVGKNSCKFNAAPKIDVINKRMVYNEAGSPLNPFSLTISSSYKITYLLEQIFRLVNPSISYPDSLIIIHDWQFQGKRSTNECYLNNIIFDELLQFVDPLFFDNTYGISNCGDILKKLAIDWCAFTGLISEDKAFFKKLFHWDVNNLQTVKVNSFRKGYRYGLIDYIKVTTGISDPAPYEEGVFTQLEDRYLTRKSLPGFFLNAGISSGSNITAFINRTNYFVFDHGSAISNYPSEGDIYSNNGSEFKVVGTPYADGSVSFKIATVRITGINDPEASGSLTKVSGTGDLTITYTSFGDANANSPNYYQIHQTRDPNLFNNAFKNHGALLAKFWYTYRGNIQNCRVDKFVFRGVNYDYLKDFQYDGKKYQPISMVFDYAKNETICEAIYLGVSPYPDPFL